MCFEYLYFMNHDSEINNMTIYNYRYKLGIALAKKERTINYEYADTIVVGSPKSGISAGERVCNAKRFILQTSYQ